MKKFILWSVAPLLLPPALLRHSGPYIPDDQLQKEIRTLGPDYDIDMSEYSKTIISDMPYIKFNVDSVSTPPVLWEPFYFTFSMYICLNGEYNGINYYMRVSSITDPTLPTPEKNPEATWGIIGLFTRDPHFVFHGLKVGDKIPRERWKEFESHGRRIALKSDTTWLLQMSENVPVEFHNKKTIVAFWRTGTSGPLVDSIMESQYWTEEMEKKPDSLFLKLSKYKIDMFR